MSNSISLSTIIELFDYNYWARDRQFQICAGLTDEQFQRPMGSSFTSIRDTMVHMFAVEWLWLERWRGKSPQYLLETDKYPILSTIEERWYIVEREMKEYLAGLKDEVIEQPITCISSRGQKWTFTLWRMILHLISHQSYHRGQVTTLLRQLDVQPSKVDFLDGFELKFRS